MPRLPLLCIIAASYNSLLAFQEPVRLTQKKPIEALGIARSDTLELHAGETVVVSAEAGPTGKPEFDTYIYSDKKVLLARDSPDEATENFKWTTGVPQRVYVLARSTGNYAGTVMIEVQKASPQISGSRAAEPQTAIVSVYYATNRIPTANAIEPFGTEFAPDGKMQFGLCRVSIPRDHRMGEMEGPSIWKLEFRPNPAKHILMSGPPLTASEQEFFTTVKDKIRNSPHKQAVVFVHGFDTTFTGAALRTAQISYDLGFDGPAIFYSWPSHGSLSPLDYNADGRNADLTAAHFQRFLGELSERSGVQTVHLIAHSMGGRITV